MRSLFHDFYVQPMNIVYIETIAMYVIWTVAMLLLRGKAKRIVSIAGLCMAAALVIAFTILGRKSGNTRDISLIPFISFVNAKVQPEFYRTMYMNMLLFMPLGLSMPFALPNKCKHKALLTILIGAILSIAVEACQYLFSLGKCETDDVIMNTIGVAIGVTSFLIFQFFVHIQQRHCNN